MKTCTYLALAASAKLAFAHTTIFAAWINDVDQGLGNTADGYIRTPPNNDPVKDVTSSDMTCNVNNVATAETLSVAAGDKVRHSPLWLISSFPLTRSMSSSHLSGTITIELPRMTLSHLLTSDLSWSTLPLPRLAQLVTGG